MKYIKAVHGLGQSSSFNTIKTFQAARHQSNLSGITGFANKTFQQINQNNKNASAGVARSIGAEANHQQLAKAGIDGMAGIANAVGMDPRHLGFAQAMAKGDKTGALAATGLDQQKLGAVQALSNGDYMGALAASGLDPRVAGAGKALMSGDYMGALASAGIDPRIAGAGKSLMSGDYLGALAAAGVDPRAVGAAKAMMGGDPLGALAAATGVDAKTLGMAKSLMNGDVLGALSDKTGLPIDQAAKFLKSPAAAAKTALGGGSGLGGGGGVNNASSTEGKDSDGLYIGAGGGGSGNGKSSGAASAGGADGNVSDADAGSCSCSNEPGANDTGEPSLRNADTKTSCCPISVVTGEELLEHSDFTIGNIIPFHWVRTYRSSKMTNDGLGYGWSFPLSERILIQNRTIKLKDKEGRNISFPFIVAGETAENTSEKLILHRENKESFVLWNALNPTDPYKRFHYDANTEEYRVSAIEDLHGNAWHCRYRQGQLCSLRSTWGEALVFEYQQDLITEISTCRYQKNGDSVVKLSDSQRILMQYQYDTEEDMVAAIDAMGHREQYRFENHIITQRTLKTGYNYYFKWDQLNHHGKCLRNWGDDINGVPTYNYHFDYDKDNRVTRVTDTRGGMETTYYNERSQVTRVIDPMGHEVQTFYDAQGNLVETVNPAGYRTQYVYDELQRLTQTTDVLGNTTALTYNAFGKVETLTSPQGLSTYYQYNKQGLLTSIISPNGQVQYLEYNEQGLLLNQHSGDKVGMQYQWDEYAQLVQQQNEDLTVDYVYDSYGHISKIKNAQGEVIHYEYYANGQVKSICDGKQKQSHYQYNADGLLTQYLSADGSKLQYKYVGLSQPVERIDSAGHRLRYEYDGERNLIALHNENNDTYRFDYDLNENLIREITFDGRIKLHQYDENAYVVKSREFVEGQFEPIQNIEYRRDRLGRLLEQYNSAEDYLIFNYQGSQLISADNGKCLVQFEYDPLGRLIAEVQGEQRIHYRYDDQGRLQSTQLPDQRVLHYHYDKHKSEITLNEKKLVEMHYNPLGQETQRIYGQLLDQKQYDNAGRLIQHKVSSRERKHSLIHRQYHFDAASGLLQKVNDQQRGITHYRYDAKQQLLETQGIQPESFVYDPSGNLLQDESNAPGNRLNIQGDKHFEYDAQGKLIKERRGKEGKLETHYSYNGFNQLTQIEKRKAGKVSQLTTYEYDALGRRISKEDAFGRTKFLWQGDQLLSEQRENIHKVFLYEGSSFTPFALLQDEKVYYYQNDHIGTPQELVDEWGKIVWSVKYKAFGGIAEQYENQIQNPLRFQGQYFDEESGLHYNRHRYYDPSLGRFITQDPIGLVGGLNNYQYVPNPVHWVDPLGLKCTECSASGDNFVDNSIKHTPFNGDEVWNPNDPTFHHYDTLTKICSVDQPGCTIENVEAIRDMYSYPGEGLKPTALALGDDEVAKVSIASPFKDLSDPQSYGPGRWPITQERLADGSIKNITLKGHMVYPGTITRSVVQGDDGYISISTHGIGYNRGYSQFDLSNTAVEKYLIEKPVEYFSAYGNDKFGPEAFAALDAQTKKEWENTYGNVEYNINQINNVEVPTPSFEESRDWVNNSKRED